MTFNRFWLAALGFSAAAGATPPNDRLVEIASRGLDRAADRWSIHPRFVRAENDHITSRPNGEIEVGKAALRRIAIHVPDQELNTVIGWVMAHEAWHQVQFARGLSTSQAPAERQLNECEADTVAAHATVDTLIEHVDRASREKTGEAAAASLSRIVTVVEDLEEGFNGALDHPPAIVRGLAVRSGSGRAVYERIYQFSSSPEMGVVRDRLAKLHDIREQEDIAHWARRLCELMLHHGDGVPSLALDRSSIQWNTSADMPTVRYSFPYRNNGTQPIHVSMQVRSASVPRSAPFQTSDVSQWTFADVQVADFDLQPGATYRVTGVLEWYATKELKPRLLYPMVDPSFYDARIESEPGTTSRPTVLLDLSPEVEQMRASLETLYTASLTGFRSIAPTCRIEHGEETCPLTLPVPGVVEGEITRHSDGSSEARMTLYRGNSEKNASAAYQRFHERIRAIYPALTITYSQDEDARRFSLQPSPHATLRAYKRKWSDGDYTVEAVVEPKLF